MNLGSITFEILLTLISVGVLLTDLVIPANFRRGLAYVAASLVGCLLVFSLGELAPGDRTAFGGLLVIDSLARFFKPLFLFAAMVVLVMAAEYEERLGSGLSEFCALALLATVGMMLAASSNDFVMLFVSLELITVTFYVLNSFQKGRLSSIEAGIKYLILGATASAFMVYGIALVFGAANTTRFPELFARQAELAHSPLLLAGLLLVLVGLGFKIAAFPFQIWAPDVYQGAPAPATAFLAVGSKTAGFALLLRVLLSAVPNIAVEWRGILIAMAAITILYGSLCAIPQRSLKRLMGYSSIANAGFLLLGLTTAPAVGVVAILYYLAAYFFTVLAAFLVVTVILRDQDSDDLAAFAGLGQRSPLLAASLTLAMASLAGIPPLAGFVGKFLLLKSVIGGAATDHRLYWLTGIALVGAVISVYYYFGVVRSMYWGKNATHLSPIIPSIPVKLALAFCVLGMLFVGLAPGGLIRLASTAGEAVVKAAPVPAHTAGK